MSLTPTKAAGAFPPCALVFLGGLIVGAGNQFLPPTAFLAERMDSVDWTCTIAAWNLVVSVSEDCVQVSQDTDEPYDAECRIGSRWPVEVHEEPAVLGLRSDLPERGSTSQFGLRLDSVTANHGSL